MWNAIIAEDNTVQILSRERSFGAMLVAPWERLSSRKRLDVSGQLLNAPPARIGVLASRRRQLGNRLKNFSDAHINQRLSQGGPHHMSSFLA
jgi:hypothetical protein